MALIMGNSFFMQFAINQTDTLAGTSQELVAPYGGYIEGLQTSVQIAPTTGGPVTVKINGSAVTGLTVTVADAAAKGTRQIDAPDSPGAVYGIAGSRQFRKGDRIEIVPDAAFATAGAISGNLLCRASETASA